MPAEAGPRRRPRRRALAEAGVIVLTAVLLAGLIRTFAFPTFWIPSASMVPTLGVYDRVLVQKAFFSWRDVREGDIVVFSQPPLDQCGPQEGGDLVKRVIALPGQTIYTAGGSIYIAGRRLAGPYLPRYDPLGPPIPGVSRQHPYRVPPGEFYMLGDNRAYSCDSRYWGPIKGRYAPRRPGPSIRRTTLSRRLRPSGIGPRTDTGATGRSPWLRRVFSSGGQPAGQRRARMVPLSPAA